MFLKTGLNKTTKGFSLIEMSIVLVIMSILIGSGISIAMVQMENARIEATKNKQSTIKTALLNFMSRNYRLPCPAVANLVSSNANYGVEAANPGTCTGVTGFGGGSTRNVRGIIPWKSLGLTDETAIDGYGRRFTYQVLRNQTNLTQDTVSGLQGNISIFDAAGGTQINPNYPAVAIVLSHGSNGRGAYLPGSGRRMAVPATADEAENTDNDTNFVQKGYSTLDTNPFDDILLWLEPGELVTQLSQIGSIKTADYLLNTRFNTLRNTLLGVVAGDNADPDGGGARTMGRRLPYADGRANPIGSSNGAVNGYVPWTTIGLTASEATDPWGNYIRYSVTASLASPGISATAPVSPATYSLSSDGADGIQGNGDDQSIIVDVNSLRGSLISAGVLLDP